MTRQPAVAVSLFAVGNGLGRLMMGPLSDRTHRSKCVVAHLPPLSLTILYKSIANSHQIYEY
jgi:MFS family permease